MVRLNKEQVVNVVDCLYDKLCMPDLERKDGEPLKHAKWVICSDGYYVPTAITSHQAKN